MNYNEYVELVNTVSKHNYLYHNKDEPVISDIEYDRLFDKLLDFERINPELALEYSPTQKIGSDVANEFQSISHEIPLLSLQNTYNIQELKSFENSIKKDLSEYDLEFKGYSLEYKIDGLSVAIKYVDGIFHSALTRGNGLIGEDVSENVKTIKNLPLKLNEPLNIIVRGEVYLPKHEFKTINESQLKKGENIFSNPRNAAAGSLRQKNSKITASRNLNIFVFDILKGSLNQDSHFKTFEILRSLGFKTVESFKINTIEEAYKIIGNTEKIRNELEYEIDGMVLKVDSIESQIKIGNRTRTPKWAVAYKFKAQKELTKILEITTRVGRSGAITPRAKFIPVDVAGSTIEYATLHNQDYIDELDIRIGDTVEVEKAGDVIPKVVRVIKEKRNGSEKKFTLPTTCPSCNSETIRYDGEAALKCPNPKCPAKYLRSIIHFVSKSAMDIDGLGEAVVTQLVSNNLIKDFSDLYVLSSKTKDLLTLEKMGEKKVQNILDAVENSKQNSLEKLITGLGISLVGERAAKILSSHFKDLEKIIEAKYNDFINIDEIGTKMAESIVDFFEDQDNKNIITKLKEYGLNFKYIGNLPDDSKLTFKDEIIVLTGKLESYSRKEAKDIIEELGGKTSSSVSSKTTLLLSGESSGSKYKKALELSVKIINEDEFKKMLES